MTTPDKDRAAFETYAASKGMNLDKYEGATRCQYKDRETATSWEDWQAACADRDKRIAELVEPLKKQLVCFHNFPVHPNCCAEDKSSESSSPAEYRQGWMDCYWAIYNRFKTITKAQGE